MMRRAAMVVCLLVPVVAQAWTNPVTNSAFGYSPLMTDSNLVAAGATNFFRANSNAALSALGDAFVARAAALTNNGVRLNGVALTNGADVTVTGIGDGGATGAYAYIEAGIDSYNALVASYDAAARMLTLTGSPARLWSAGLWQIGDDASSVWIGAADPATGDGRSLVLRSGMAGTSYRDGDIVLEAQRGGEYHGQIVMIGLCTGSFAGAFSGDGSGLTGVAGDGGATNFYGIGLAGRYDAATRTFSITNMAGATNVTFAGGSTGSYNSSTRTIAITTTAAAAASGGAGYPRRWYGARSLDLDGDGATMAFATNSFGVLMPYVELSNATDYVSDRSGMVLPVAASAIVWHAVGYASATGETWQAIWQWTTNAALGSDWDAGYTQTLGAVGTAPSLNSWTQAVSLAAGSRLVWRMRFAATAGVSRTRSLLLELP